MYSQCGEDWKQARVEKVFKENIKRFQKNKDPQRKYKTDPKE